MNNLHPRGKTLVIVEGKEEKEKFLKTLFQSFPEMKITSNDIYVFETNIYNMYDSICNEYGENWLEEGIDVDIAFVVSKVKNLEKTLFSRFFINIFLVFDYEMQDPNFSSSLIEKINCYFNDATNHGKLYINYPMLESYQDITNEFDNYLEKYTDVSLLKKGGYRYKDVVAHNSCIKPIFELEPKLLKYFNSHYEMNEELLNSVVLDIFNLDDINDLKNILIHTSDEKDFNNVYFYVKAQLEKLNYLSQNISFYTYIKLVFIWLIKMNIQKAYFIIENKKRDISDFLIYKSLDHNQLLKNINNNLLKEDKVWVLNTSLFIIPDYNLELLY